MIPEHLIENRRIGLAKWLADKHPALRLEQKHLDEGTIERAYWHYGYMSALRDVLAGSFQPTAPPAPEATEEK